MNISQAKNISLTHYLEAINCPVINEKHSGNDLWYCSPARKENTPSFHINVQNNWWYDQGERKGGSDVISLAQFILNTDVSGALRHLQSLFNGVTVNVVKKDLKTPLIKPPKSQFIESKELFFDWHFEYLKMRNIDERIGKHYLKNVRYKIVKDGGEEKEIWSLGFRNQKGGWELRLNLPKNDETQAHQKSSISPKFMTFVPGTSNETIDIFEGFSDFLPHLSYFGNGDIKPHNSTIILNTLAFDKKAYEKLSVRINEPNSKIKRIRTFFDNHPPGYKSHDLFTNLPCEVIPMNYLYTDFEDIGAMIAEKACLI